MALLSGHAPFDIGSFEDTRTQSGKYWQNVNPQF